MTSTVIAASPDDAIDGRYAPRIAPEPGDIERARRALGAAPTAWRAVPGHGPPRRADSSSIFPDGRSAFVKIAAVDYVAEWFRDDRLAYEALEGCPFLPRLLGWDDDGAAPLLAIEDLSGARCLVDGRAVLVDWNHAFIGNPLVDTAAWLPSLQSEGGPAPEEILPDDTPDLPETAALLAGYFCARAGLPPIPQAPHARPLQLAQARTSLPWAARLLGLPPPG